MAIPKSPESPITGAPADDMVKDYTETVEMAGWEDDIDPKRVVQEQYVEGDDEHPRTGWRRIFRSNPSSDFIREVAELNSTTLDPVEVRKAEVRIFLLIVPALALDYMFYYIDKTTLQYAALFGIKQELDLKGTDYSTLGAIFYIGWLVWAIPGNLLVAKFPLSKYLAVHVFLWGLFLMVQAFSQSFAAMVALRFLSGVFEAVADPCFIAITSMWFTRKQQPTVIGLWNAANGVGIALGGLIGYGIGHIKSSNGWRGWRWEFLIVGLCCALWAILMGYLVPDAPHKSRWLTRRQGLILMSRKRDDHHTIERRQLHWDQVKEFLLDPKSYLFFLLGFTANIPNSASTNFGTLIVAGLGFNEFTTTLLQIPYGVWNSTMVLIAAFVAHKTHHLNVRTYIMCGICSLTVIGYALMRFAEGNGPKLLGYYLGASSNAVFVLGMSCVAGNVGGTTKKVLTSAALFLGFSSGNIVSPYCFIASEAPTYSTGIIVCLASRAMEILVIVGLRLCFVLPNKARDKAFANGDADSDPSVITYSDLGDKKNKHFRYIA